MREQLKKEQLRQEVKLGFFKLYEQGKMNKELAEQMVDKAEKMEKMELELWHNDIKKEVK